MTDSVNLDQHLIKVQNAELNMLEDFFGNFSKVADVLNVSRSRVSKWNKGEKPDDINKEKIAGISYLLTILLNNYYPEVAFGWLYGSNPFINNRKPIDLLKLNKLSDVISAAKQSIAGSYA